MDDCLFCKIIKNEVPCHKIWEDNNHLAFLSIFPNTEGFSVVATKEHYPSYVFEVDDDVIKDLLMATKKVAELLDSKLEDVGRCGLIAEGFGVDHLHFKLFPMHGTADMTKWAPLESTKKDYYKIYPGFISSHDAGREEDEKLENLAKRIRND